MFPFEWQAHPLAYALGRALLHSLWQGAGVAILLAAALSLLRGRSPQARYAAACAALGLMLLLPALTVWRLGDAPHDAYAAAAAEETAPAGVTPASGQLKGAAPGAVSQASAGVEPAEARGRSGEGMRRLLPWLALVWLAGVVVLSARMLGGLVYARRLRRQGVRAVGEFWQERAVELARRLRLTRPVEVLESALVQVPTAVGWLRPVVLLPASALTGLTPRQLESILAHELAHIRRHDYLLNLLQLVAETLLFYHPAAWWVSSRVRAEREHVCDDLAVRVCGDALTYARALTRMERLRRAPSPQVVLAASGGNLTSRILRLVETEPRRGRPSTFAVALCLAATLLTAAACTRAVLSDGQKPGERASKASPAEPSSAVVEQSSSGRAPDRFAGDSVEGEDAEVRRAAVEALGTREGAVVVMDPRTGRVYSVVNQEWALRRGWAPASMMKLIVSLAGVGERLIDPAERVRVSAKSERMDLTEALAVSDNNYFKSAGARVGAEHIVDYARRLGLGEPTGINYEGEAAGRLPSVDKNTNSVQVGFGEGVEVTPVQLAVLVSALANGGTLYVPQLPRAGQEAEGSKGRVRGRAELPAEARGQVLAGMLAAVERGTASSIEDASLKVAGKTGTIASKDSKRNIGWFASYAPADDPRLTVVVLTSGEGEKGRSAAQVAGSVYKALRARL